MGFSASRVRADDVGEQQHQERQQGEHQAQRAAWPQIDRAHGRPACPPPLGLLLRRRLELSFRGLFMKVAS